MFYILFSITKKLIEIFIVNSCVIKTLDLSYYETYYLNNSEKKENNELFI